MIFKLERHFMIILLNGEQQEQNMSIDDKRKLFNYQRTPFAWKFSSSKLFYNHEHSVRFPSDKARNIDTKRSSKRHPSKIPKTNQKKFVLYFLALQQKV